MISKLLNKLFYPPYWGGVGLTIAVLCYSGNPAPGILFPYEIQLSLLAAILAILLVKSQRVQPRKSVIIVVIIFTLILSVQCISFSFYPYITMIGFFTRLFIGYALMRLIKNFPRAYVQAMVLLTLLSFVFYLPYVTLPSLGLNIEATITSLARLLGTITENRRALLLHTFLSDGSTRNCGIFWEPGAFAGYLTLALIFLAHIKKDLPKHYYKIYFSTLSIGLVTTLSTTGYVVYPLVLLLHYDWQTTSFNKTLERLLLAVFFIVPLLAASTLFSYQHLDFLQEKIQQQLQTVEHSKHGWQITRFGSLMFDWEYIQRNPISGWGLHSKTRFSLHPGLSDELRGMGNGFSDFTVKFGVIGMGTWFWGVFTGFRKLFVRGSTTSILVSLIILMLLQGETFLNYPLFLGLMFLPYSLSAFHDIPNKMNTNRKAGTNFSSKIVPRVF